MINLPPKDQLKSNIELYSRYIKYYESGELNLTEKEHRLNCEILKNLSEQLRMVETLEQIEKVFGVNKEEFINFLKNRVNR